MEDEVVEPEDFVITGELEEASDEVNNALQEEVSEEDAIQETPFEVSGGVGDQARQVAQAYRQMAAESVGEVKEQPRLESFRNDVTGELDYEKFSEAMTSFKQAQFAADLLEKMADRHESSTGAEIQTKYQSISAKGKKQYADFDSVFTPNTPVSPFMAEAIVSSDKAEDICYYLGKHPDLASKIAALPPHRQGYEIGRLEKHIGPKTVHTKASDPPKASVSSIRGTARKGYNDLSWADFCERREREEAQRG